MVFYENQETITYPLLLGDAGLADVSYLIRWLKILRSLYSFKQPIGGYFPEFCVGYLYLFDCNLLNSFEEKD